MSAEEELYYYLSGTKYPLDCGCSCLSLINVPYYGVSVTIPDLIIDGNTTSFSDNFYFNTANPELTPIYENIVDRFSPLSGYYAKGFAYLDLPVYPKDIIRREYFTDTEGRIIEPFAYNNYPDPGIKYYTSEDWVNGFKGSTECNLHFTKDSTADKVEVLSHDIHHQITMPLYSETTVETNSIYSLSEQWKSPFVDPPRYTRYEYNPPPAINTSFPFSFYQTPSFESCEYTQDGGLNEANTSRVVACLGLISIANDGNEDLFSTSRGSCRMYGAVYTAKITNDLNIVQNGGLGPTDNYTTKNNNIKTRKFESLITDVIPDPISLIGSNHVYFQPFKMRYDYFLNSLKGNAYSHLINITAYPCTTTSGNFPYGLVESVNPTKIYSGMDVVASDACYEIGSNSHNVIGTRLYLTKRTLSKANIPINLSFSFTHSYPFPVEDNDNIVSYSRTTKFESEARGTFEGWIFDDEYIVYKLYYINQENANSFYSFSSGPVPNTKNKGVITGTDVEG